MVAKSASAEQRIPFDKQQCLASTVSPAFASTRPFLLLFKWFAVGKSHFRAHQMMNTNASLRMFANFVMIELPKKRCTNGASDERSG